VHTRNTNIAENDVFGGHLLTWNRYEIKSKFFSKQIRKNLIKNTDVGVCFEKYTKQTLVAVFFCMFTAYCSWGYIVFCFYAFQWVLFFKFHYFW